MSTTWEAYDLVIIVRRLEDSLYLEQGRSQLPTCGEQRHADAFWCRVFTDTVRYGRQHKVISCNGQTMDFKTHVAGYLVTGVFLLCVRLRSFTTQSPCLSPVNEDLASRHHVGTVSRATRARPVFVLCSNRLDSLMVSFVFVSRLDSSPWTSWYHQRLARDHASVDKCEC